jgi:hypothetical protein
MLFLSVIQPLLHIKLKANFVYFLINGSFIKGLVNSLRNKNADNIETINLEIRTSDDG